VVSKKGDIRAEGVLDYCAVSHLWLPHLLLRFRYGRPRPQILGRRAMGSKSRNSDCCQEYHLVSAFARDVHSRGILLPEASLGEDVGGSGSDQAILEESSKHYLQDKLSCISLCVRLAREFESCSDDVDDSEREII